jgi:hypothetical protein
MPDAAAYHCAVALKVARLNDVSVGVESVVASVFANVAFETQQDHRDRGRRWMSAHDVQHTQPANDVEFEAKQHELRRLHASSLKFTCGIEVFQGSLTRFQMQHASARRNELQRNESCLRVQHAIIDDENIR